MEKPDVVMVQPVIAQPVVAQPVMAQPMATQPMAAVPIGGAPLGRPAPPGAPDGGAWSREMYTGNTTLLIVLLLVLFFWPALCAPFCCPCDQREVYIAPNGVKYVGSGQIVPQSDCCGNPCGGPAA